MSALGQKQTSHQQPATTQPILLRDRAEISFRRRAGGLGHHNGWSALRANVCLQKNQWRIGVIGPLVQPAMPLKVRSTRWFGLGLAVGDEDSRSGEDVVKRRA